MNEAVALADALLAELKQRPEIYMVGIAGIPGSGKSTLARALAGRVPGAVVIAMDGYHIPRSRLDAEGLRRRGAAHTFDADVFRADLTALRRTRSGVFPTFDHAEKDPRAGAIRVTPAAPLVIVEGLYVLLRDWHAESLFDLRVFLDCNPDEARVRLFVRHVKAGVSATPEEARHRVETSDRLNAEAILADGCRERAQVILRSNDGALPRQGAWKAKGGHLAMPAFS
ncbi:MAG: nucleoside/nucleotide kinase family protein [Verrucomicrobia bacterium]|nr:MAG: nucleoside/nucleotide kinase family protein [Verrucomicrobiota bacterium]